MEELCNIGVKLLLLSASRRRLLCLQIQYECNYDMYYESPARIDTRVVCDLFGSIAKQHLTNRKMIIQLLLLRCRRLLDHQFTSTAHGVTAPQRLYSRN